MAYESVVYRTESGQWAWAILMNGVGIARGIGYLTEEDAESALADRLAEHRYGSSTQQTA